jgi:hypothetical protein
MLKKLITAGFLAVACCLLPSPAPAQISLSIRIGPPVLPVYVQPPCPTPGYLWTPGYWSYAEAGYYWVPGVWVNPPRVGVLWTPGYWGFGGGIYAFHAGYWGPHVGFYGGVNYGFGYGGHGFIGGVWSGGAFRYNTAVMNVNTTVIHNTYVDRTVINNTNIVNNRASFNGPGGVREQPTPQERSFSNEQHIQPTQNQLSHEQAARADRSQFASVNHGNPQTASMDRVGGSRFNPQAHTVNQRAENQQQRIAQGVGHGQLGAGQTRNLENREQHINQQVHADRKADDGHLTPKEHKQVNREQNHASEKIQQDKHEPHEHR